MSPPMPTLGHYFLRVLEYFGKLFDQSRMAVMNNCIVQIEASPDVLFVADPFRPDVNAAGNVTKFAEIQTCFGGCYDSLVKIYQLWENDNTGSSIKKTSILDTIYNNDNNYYM